MPDLTQLASAISEIQRLRYGIFHVIEDGAWTEAPPDTPGIRPGQCKYGMYSWEDCGQCTDEYLESLLKGHQP
ncbi:hypothetical protein CCP1ISM_110019 [Azospirillaceae bacterium]